MHPQDEVAIEASAQEVRHEHVREWKNTMYLGLKSITKLKPAEDFIEACRDALYVGGKLSKTAHDSIVFYDGILNVFNVNEQLRLKNEIGERAFPWVVVSADARKNVSGVRMYYVACNDGKFSIQMRCIGMQKLVPYNSTAVAQQIKSCLAKLRCQLKDLGAWVADGSCVNGVHPKGQTERGENVCAKLSAGRGPQDKLLRYWSACHRLGLVLEDICRLDEFRPFLIQLDGFFESVGKMLHFSPMLQDKLAHCIRKPPSLIVGGNSFAPPCGSWKSRARWLINLAENYPGWISFFVVRWRRRPRFET